MNLIEYVKEWLHRLLDRRETRAKARTQREVEARIQIREIDGGIYLTLDHKPVSMLTGATMAEVLQELLKARKVFYDYLLSQRRAY